MSVRVVRGSGTFRILLAEDSADSRLVFEGYFGTTPHELMCVEDGREAVEAYKAGSFDLVLLDIMMPVLDGYGAARDTSSRTEKGVREVPVWALSAHTREDDVKACLQAGFDGHFGKPIRKHQMLEAVDQLLYKAPITDDVSQSNGEPAAIRVEG